MNAEQIVKEEIYANANAMMYELRDVASKLPDYDTYTELCIGKADYEEAASHFILCNADEDDLQEIVDYFEDWKDFEGGRKKIATLVTDPRWVCDEFELDVEYNEIFQHWIVSEWLGEKLEEQGEVVGEYMGFTIWGRATCGQSIAMDWVIQKIAAEVSRENLNS